MVKILHLMPALNVGGIETSVLNYFKRIDSSKVNCDVAVFIPTLGKCAEEFQKMGSKVYILPQKSKDIKGYKTQLIKIIREGQYDIVHAHQSYQSFIPLRYAKKCGVKVRIAHAHSTMIDHCNLAKKMLFLLSRLLNRFYVTDYFACGIDAGKVMFGNAIQGKNARVIKNAVENENYAFSQEEREIVRNKMGWKDKIIIGNVGRLSPEKNQLFLIKIFHKISKMDDNAILCICGEGEERKKIETLIKELGICDKVQLLGSRDDVAELMNGFDVFVLPSLFEGLPVTGIEALTNGIPCVMSDTITQEFDEYGKVRFISLDAPVDLWAETVLDSAKQGHDITMSRKMKNIGYDIVDAAKSLENFYINRV